MFIPNVAPSDNRSGTSYASRTVPLPLMSLCRRGSATISKMRSGGAGMNRSTVSTHRLMARRYPCATLPGMTVERFEVRRQIAAPPAKVFALLCDPRGHVAIDSSGMLQSAEGETVTKVGDEFVVHMDRESLNDYPLGKYDVRVIITALEPDAHIEWTISGVIQPPIRHLYGYRLEPSEVGTLVTSYYDWSQIDEAYRDKGVFPVIPEAALRATLGILARTVEA